MPCHWGAGGALRIRAGAAGAGLRESRERIGRFFDALSTVGAVALLSLGPLTRATAQQGPFTHADTLRGSITPERAWWDVTFYDLHVTIDPSDSTVRGWNSITYRTTGRPHAMQIDLQTPLEVDSMVQDGRTLHYRREGTAV